jgi:hypothetical protein
MSLISSSIPNLVNGVSQQPFILRLSSQSEEQINAYSSVVEGLRKRPPTKHRARIGPASMASAAMHIINRDASERYQVVASNGNIQVFTLGGTEVSVAAPNGLAYLTSADPASDFKFVTVADHTFVLNKAQVAASNGGVQTPPRPYEALVWVRQGDYGATYTVSINGIAVTHSTLDAAATNASFSIGTSVIAAALVTALQGAGFVAPLWSVTAVGSVIYITNNSVPFALATQDGRGETALRGILGSVQKFSDLPAQGAPPGFVVKVKGSLETNQDDYYLTFDAGTGAGGIWRECVKPAELYKLAPASMPHVLVREAGGTFTFKQATWGDRVVGDIDSSPWPSFVGRTINDVFFYRNRLGFLTDENVVLSRAGQFFDFFRETALQNLDTDPIDVAVSHVKVSILQHAVPFNQTLLLFSEQTQFQFGKADLLTPKTVAINQTTEFECSTRVKPVAAGNSVYFASDRGSSSAVREYYVDADTQTNDAADVTAHCPTYVPNQLTKLAISPNEDVLISRSAARPNELFVYRYYWQGTEKLQSSWSRWVWPAGDNILSLEFLESELWLVVSRWDGTYLESMSVESAAVDAPLHGVIHLDRRVQAGDCAVSQGTGLTQITPPFKLTGAEEAANFRIVAFNDPFLNRNGRVIPFTTTTAGDGTTTFTTKGAVAQFFLGRAYDTRYRFSTLVLREQSAGGGQQAVASGRLQVRRMTVTFSNTGYFRAEVTPRGRDMLTRVFTGKVLGSSANLLGEINLETGSISFPVMCENKQATIELVNDSHLPSAFLSAEWEAFYHGRAQRL